MCPTTFKFVPAPLVIYTHLGMQPMVLHRGECLYNHLRKLEVDLMVMVHIQTKTC